MSRFCRPREFLALYKPFGPIAEDPRTLTPEDPKTLSPKPYNPKRYNPTTLQP